MRTLLIIAMLSSVAGCSDAPAQKYVTMRDGTRLATDVHLPEGQGPFPTILVRTPYGKDEELFWGPRYAPFGIAVVTQDMRGRFASEGVDGVFRTDGDDGYDTCEWITGQPWSNGKIAMMGESARGIAQYMVAPKAPPGLVAISPQVAAPNIYSGVLFQGGAYRYALVHNWLEEQGSLIFEEEVAKHPFLEEFWSPVETLGLANQVAVPGLHLAGWQDVFLQGTIDAFVAYQHQGASGARGRQKLIIGPWAHTGGSELVYPKNSEEFPISEDEFVLHHLGVRTSADIENRASVHYYVMGDVDDADAPGNHWREADDWPPDAADVRLHLGAGGSLSEACPGDEGGASSYTFDPSSPSPTICGNNLTIEAGACDQRAIEERGDVLVFETDVLTEPLEVTGRMAAHLFVDIDQTDADIVVRLTDVYPDGRSMLVADGILRLAHRASPERLEAVTPNKIVEAVVDLWSTSIIFNTGHRLRVSITSSNAPRFAVNRNNGLPFPDYVTGPANTVNVNVHHADGAASYLELPNPQSPQSVVTRCDK